MVSFDLINVFLAISRNGGFQIQVRPVLWRIQTQVFHTWIQWSENIALLTPVKMTLYRQVWALLLVKGKPATHDNGGSSSHSSGKNAILLDGGSRNGVPVGWRLQEKVWRGKSWRKKSAWKAYTTCDLTYEAAPVLGSLLSPLGADPWPHSKDLDSWTEMETTAHGRWHGACGLTQLDSLFALKKKKKFSREFK